MKAFENILVPLDFSAVSENALQYAIQFVQKVEGKKLYVLHAFRLPSTVTFAGYADDIINVQSIEEEVRNELKKIEKKLLQDVQVPYEILTGYGFAEDIITQTIEKSNIDLVIMGSRGKGAVAKLLGTTTVDIMTESHCPVLAIPEHAKFQKIQKIVFAADYKKVDRPETFELLAQMAEIFHAEIEILHIDTQKKITEEGVNVGDAIDRSLHKVPHHYQVIAAANVNEGIQTYLKKHEVSMVAMMPRHHSFLDRVLHGSKTKDMLFHTPVPLLTFHN